MNERSKSAVIVFLASITAVGLLCAFFSRWNNTTAVTDTTSGNNRSPMKTPFTTDELRYVLYGEGTTTVSPRDPRYLDYIRSLVARHSPYRPNSAGVSQNDELAMIVDKRLRGRNGGFFVECGASTGGFWSNTLFLEKERQWTGLLVEANRRFAGHLLHLNRQAYVFTGCLSPYNRPGFLKFKAAGYQGGLKDRLGVLNADIDRQLSFESLDFVYCVPLGDLLAALGVNQVDFLSLDTQGSELDILKTLDLDKIRIDIIIAESATHESTTGLREFFNKTGKYRVTTSKGYDMMVERLDLD